MSDVVVHYDGDASLDQQIALFDTLSNTLQEQVDTGRFTEIAKVHHAEATIDGYEDFEFSSSGKESGNAARTGMMAGGAIAGVAIAILAVVFLFRKRKGKKATAEKEPHDEEDKPSFFSLVLPNVGRNQQ